ncbi:5-oxoprolinase subunit PxpB [Winogradskyella thalassocola]|uniref:Inhibitor of KinA n=1 Tax=Winogradskyella thalassocola TaxID=262004 RepID=A0A1G8KN87_9FLAO|nr:5-oxoprolinase subunit PxpB [Winogradskyella thalassocola]SDI44863.1 inhibitor of KinA [Winogradskyella thalassocola]
MSFQLQYSQYNEHSVLVEWPAIIDENILEDILFFKEKVENKLIKEVVEVISAYHSILIIYKFTIDNVNDVFVDLKELYSSQSNVEQIESKTFRIPVCYEGEFAMDLDCYAKEIKRSKEVIISLHSNTIYTVFFIGFLPGFLYLGGLNSDLYLDRKITPNLNIKKGSIGIGGKQTGIYPQDSPGGWHIIGNSPIELFNPKHNPPCFITAGDRVKFHPISKLDHQKMKSEINNPKFDFKTLLLND